MNGKGLGLNEEGDTEFVKIKKKRDNSGECHVIYGNIFVQVKSQIVSTCNISKVCCLTVIGAISFP